jgi:transposase InsO family protein
MYQGSGWIPACAGMTCSRSVELADSNIEEARSDVFDYIELFYNTRRRHGANDQLSPVKYEQQYLKRLAGA